MSDLKKEVLEIAEYLGCNGGELWIEIEKLIKSEQNSLLDRLIQQKKRYITELAWKHAKSEEAIPLTALIAEKDKLK